VKTIAPQYEPSGFRITAAGHAWRRRIATLCAARGCSVPRAGPL